MKKLTLLSILLSFFAASRLCAQSAGAYSVSGSVEVQAFPGSLSVRVADKSGTVVADSTFNSPSFRVTVPSPGEYTVLLAVEGYDGATRKITVEEDKPAADLGAIPMEIVRAIDEVVVMAEGGFVKNTAGGFVYNVLGDPDSKKLKMKEFFEKVPGVRIDRTSGNLVYEDNRRYLLLIDGRKHMFINGSRQYAMNLIQADYMSTIEVMDPAPAPWDAEADVVIDIRLAKELPNGFAADLNLLANTVGTNFAYADMTYKYFDLILNVNYNFTGMESPVLTNKMERETTFPDEPVNRYDSRTDSHSYNHMHIFTFGASYEVSNKNSLSLLLNTQKNDISSHQRSTVTNSLGGIKRNEYSSHNNTRTTDLPKLNGAFTYQRTIEGGQITMSYGLSQSQNDIDFLASRKYTYPEDSIAGSHSTDNTSSLSHDASLTVRKKLSAKHGITGGARYTNRHYDNLSQRDEWDWESESWYAVNDGLDYRQHVGGVSGSYSFNVRRISLSAQLTGEYVSNKGEFTATRKTPLDYSEFNLLPKVIFSLMSKNKNRLFLAFTKNVMRPGLNYLNPFRDDSDPQNIVVGEPRLRSERSYSVNTSYQLRMFKKKILLRPLIGAQYVDRAVESYKYVDENNVATTTYRNLGHRTNYQARMYVTYEPNMKVRVTGSYSGFWNRFYSSESGTRMTRGFLYSFDVTVIPWKGGFLSGSVQVLSRPSQAQEKTVSASSIYHFAINQDIIKNKLRCGVWISEPHRNRSSVTTEIDGNGFRSSSVQDRLGRRCQFFINWTFGRLKDKVREAGAGISRDDLSRPTD